jgi:hypothetical protein
MTRLAAYAHEWRQFRLLVGVAVRHLLSTVTVARDADPMHVAIWSLALVATPPFLVAVRKIIEYPFLLRAPQDVFAHVLLADRLFFIVYGSLAMMLLAALVWDGLVPTRSDQELVGALPVRPRTLAAARLAAATAVALVAATAINLPTAVLYSVVSSIHPLVGPLPRVLTGHLLATMLGSVGMFLSALALRALLTTSVGERWTTRAAIALQIAAVVSLLEVFLFLPSVLPTLIRATDDGTMSPVSLPPLWFAALFGRIAEGPAERMLAWELAVLAPLASALLATTVSLVPAAWMARRALEGQGRVGVGRMNRLTRLIVTVAVARPQVRSVLLFAVASFTRSRRHVLALAGYVGAAIAVATLGVVASSLRHELVVDAPQRYWLSVPLVAMFFAIFGLRAACGIPTDRDANWPFRLTIPTIATTRASTRAFFLSLGVLPIVAVWSACAAWLWGWPVAMWLSAFDLLAGALLCELVLWSWTKVPFVSANEPSVDTVKSRWLWSSLGLVLYGFALAEVQLWSLGSPQKAGLHVLAGLLLIGATHAATRRRGSQAAMLDAVDEGVSTLRLSPAQET